MNNFLSSCRLVLLLGTFAVASQGWSEELRIGFVNTDRVLKEANTAKAAQIKLEQEFLRREKEVADLGGTVKSMTEKLEREAPTT
jgi:outer membrane protein